jgi:hypothetical protein
MHAKSGLEKLNRRENLGDLDIDGTVITKPI